MGTPRPRPVPYDEAPRPRSDSHKARSPIGKTPTRVTPGQSARPTQFTTPRQKSEHLMRLPATTYRHGCNQDRRGSNAGISPHCFTAHSVMGGETCHYTHLTVHCLSPVTLEGGSDKARIPQSRGFGLIRLASTRPRPSLDASIVRQGRKAGVARCSGSFHRLIPNVTMVSRYGRPFPGDIATVTPTGIDKTSPQGSPVPWPPLTL
jgi:hypothetical protein